jgi:hypothetical protein
VIMAIPAEMPVTTPPDETEAIATLLLAHVPPAVASASVIEPPSHTESGPVIAATVGAVIIESCFVTKDVPQVLVAK